MSWQALALKEDAELRFEEADEAVETDFPQFTRLIKAIEVAQIAALELAKTHPQAGKYIDNCLSDALNDAEAYRNEEVEARV
jgi:hypothetical protein